MLLESAKQTIKKYNLIHKNDAVLIGVSGGPDSIALLYLLNSLKRKLRLKLYIAHLDHMLRKHSYKDADFVRKTASKLKITVSTAKVNIPALAKKGSIEEISRNIRFDFLFKTAKKIGVKKIALGHNLDDQAETVLMRILRGTGTYGLSAILPKRKITNYEIIRPLIATKRREITAFLKEKGVKFCLDPTNKEDTYLRNRIRNNLLPLLEKEYNKNIKEALSNFAETASYDYDYLNNITLKIIEKFKKRINLNRFKLLHPSLQRMLLRENIALVKGDTRGINLQHIREIEDLILNRPNNSIVDLPRGISIIKKANFISFYRH